MEEVYVIVAKDENNDDRIYIGTNQYFSDWFGMLNWYGVSHAQFFSTKGSADNEIERIRISSKLGYCDDIIRDTLEPRLITIEGFEFRERESELN